MAALPRPPALADPVVVADELVFADAELLADELVSEVENWQVDDLQSAHPTLNFERRNLDSPAIAEVAEQLAPATSSVDEA